MRHWCNLTAKESAGMCMCEQWQLHCISQWGQWMPLSEHVYCLAATFKVTEWGEQQICIKFCVKLEYSSTETIWMIQKAAAMGNWWLAASLRQCTITHHVSCRVFGKISNHSGDSASLQPGALSPLAFPKTKIAFEREEVSDHQRDSGKYDTAADGNWDNCVRSQGAYFEGDWGVIVLGTMFLVSCIFFNKCLNFSYCVAGYFLDRPGVSFPLEEYHCQRKFILGFQCIPKWGSF